jgi:glycine cleavage system aminomethyltransferase T
LTIALLPTPFHARTAERNLANAWLQRGAFTVPAHFGEPRQEALAARISAVIGDVSANEDLRVTGANAAALLSAACGVAMAPLGIGGSEPVRWCADGGGLRGLGVVSRLGDDDFLLRGLDVDIGWFQSAAARFDVAIRDATPERGLLLVGGPLAFAVLAAAGLEEASRLPLGQHAIHDWKEIGVIVFRQSFPDGYLVSCAPEDATIVFDRLVRAGRPFGLRMAGQEALELLQLEGGVALPHLDFAPACQFSAREPSLLPAGMAASGPRDGSGALRVLSGIEFDGDEPAPFAPVFRGKAEAGRTMRSAFSPALQGAIALAALLPAHAQPGTQVMVRQAGAGLPGRVVPLPFL